MNPRYAKMQRQRLAAAGMFAQGARTVDVARKFGVTWRTAYKWKCAFRTAGVEGLRSRRSPGRSRLLDEAQRRRLRAMLRSGATRFGFEDDTWTIARTHALVTRVFGISCSRVSVWRMLRALPAGAPARKRPSDVRLDSANGDLPEDTGVAM